MMFQLRSRNGPAYRHAARLWPDGRRTQADSDDIAMTAGPKRRVAGRLLPLEWRLEWPSEGLRLNVRTPLDDQWMDLDFPYWEGRVEAHDAGGKPVGKGYLEMTGYAANPNSQSPNSD
jgi:predicted secreted hydrolase